MIMSLIDDDLGCFMMFDDSTGEVIHREEFERLRKKRNYYKKKTFKSQLHDPMLTLFSYTMTKNEYQMFYKLLGYLTPQGGLSMKLAQIAKLEGFVLSSLKNMVSKYKLKNTEYMKYLITAQYPATNSFLK